MDSTNYRCDENESKASITDELLKSEQLEKDTNKEIEGYQLDKESVRQGISNVTGYEYFSYTLIKRKEGGGKAEFGKHIHSHRYQRVKEEGW